MAKPGNILGDIGESFEQIGSDVVRQTVQVPKDMAQAAAESLGLGTGKKKQSQTAKPAQGQTGEQSAAESAQHPAEPSEEVKRAIARAALEQISGKRRPEKQESVWERLQKEEEQKKLMEKKRKEEERRASLPQVSSKRKRGDLYGKQAKKTQVENRSKRQD